MDWEYFHNNERNPNAGWSNNSLQKFLNKDYVNLGNGKENIVLAGAPAKIVQNDCTRIISLEIERSVNDWFMTHLDQISYCNEQALKRCKENGQYCKLFER